MVARLADGHGRQQPAAGPQHASNLCEGLEPSAWAVVREAVERVVGADVLERRDEQHLVERPLVEGKRANVPPRVPSAGNLPFGEVDTHEPVGPARERGRQDRPARRTRSRPRGRRRWRDGPAPTGSRRSARRARAGPSGDAAARRCSARPAPARSRRRAGGRARAPPCRTNSGSSVARESVPSASFSSARSCASASGSRRRTSRYSPGRIPRRDARTRRARPRAVVLVTSGS